MAEVPKGHDKTVRVLLIDDDPDDFVLTRTLLDDVPGRAFVLDWVSDFDAGLDAITRCEHDACLLDYRLGARNGLELLREALRRGCGAPLILLTGQGDRELALEALEAGAADYLEKGAIDAAGLERALRYSMRQKRHADELERRIAERTADLEHANASLRASEDRYRVLFEAVPVAVFACDRDGVIRYHNPRAVAMWGGRALCEAEGRHISSVKLFRTDGTLIPYDRTPIAEVLRTGTPAEDVRLLFQRPGGARLAVLASFAALRDAQGEIVGAVTACEDVTELTQADSLVREGERRFREMIDALPAAIYTTDADGRLTHFNPAAVEFSGRKPELGTDQWCVSWKLYHADGTPMRHDECPMAIALKEGRIVHGVEAVAERPDGERRWFTPYPTPFRDADGRIVGGMNMLLDITDRKRAEQERQDNEQRFRMLVEQVQDYAIFMLDPQGRATSWNEGVRRVLGFDEDEFLGKDVLATVFTPEDVNDGVARRELELAAAVGSAGDDRWKVRKDGTRFWAAGKTTGLHDRDGKLLGFMKVMRDQTHQKRLEDELRQVASALSEADRRKTEFLAALGHELRNPLAPIRTGLEVMKMTKDDPATMEEIRSMMERQALQMVRLIDDLLDISRITQGKMELRKARVELADVVRSAVEATQPFVNEAGHVLTVALPPQPVLLDADPNRLAQVLSNLLNNAAKYTPAGGHLSLTADLAAGDSETSDGGRSDETVVVTVSDDGLGIPAEMQARVFEMFAQIDRTAEKGYTGLGIGLALVKRLVEMHGGTIEVRSDGPGKGSSFSVRLPVLIDSSAAVPRPVATAASPNSLRVLVVDDNVDAAEMLGMVVRVLGNEVRTAHDGVQGVEAAAEFRPDVVLMDLGMPRMNGYEAARHIRGQPWGKEMVLVALTGWGQDEDRQRTADAGFDRHLVKPAEPASLQKLFAALKPVPV